MQLSDAQERRLIRMCSEGTKIDTLAQEFRVSPRTIDRIIAKHKKRDTTLTIRRGRPRKDSTIVEEVVANLRKTPFPYPLHVSTEKMQRDLAKLRQLPLALDDNNAIRPWSATGSRTCSPFFPNRFEATNKSSISAQDAWRDERKLRRAVRFQLRHGDPVTPHRVLRAITLQCRTPSVFRPSIAHFIYKRYCPDGERVWDPCAGYGGRLLGAHAAGVHYIATDVEPRTVAGNIALAKALGARAEIYCARAEDFSPPTIDLVFTSPPYFDRERYSHAENQSWKRYGESLEHWVSGFIRPVATRAFHALRNGGHLVLNVADLREGNNIRPIVKMVLEAVLQVGFHHVETLQMPLAAVNRNAPSEPILVFKKPGGPP